MKLVTIQVTHEELADIIITAVEGGSGYWALFARYHPDEGTVDVMEDEDSGALPERIWHTIGPDRIAHGMTIAGEKYPHQLANWLRDRIGDAETADVFLQCAVFGELVYG